MYIQITVQSYAVAIIIFLLLVEILCFNIQLSLHYLLKQLFNLLSNNWKCHRLLVLLTNNKYYIFFFLILVIVTHFTILCYNAIVNVNTSLYDWHKWAFNILVLLIHVSYFKSTKMFAYNCIMVFNNFSKSIDIFYFSAAYSSKAIVPQTRYRFRPNTTQCFFNFINSDDQIRSPAKLPRSHNYVIHFTRLRIHMYIYIIDTGFVNTYNRFTRHRVVIINYRHFLK